MIPHLARVNSAGQFVRRVATRDQIPWEARLLIDRFAEQRLLTRDRRQETEVIEVAHEALLRQPPFSDWLAEDREFLLWRERLNEARIAFAADQRGVLTGRELAGRARLYAGPRRSESSSSADLAFIRESIAADDKRRAKEEEERRIREQAEREEQERRVRDAERISEAERKAKEAAERAARDATARATAETELRSAAEQKALAERQARRAAEDAATEATARQAAEADLRTTAEQKALVEQAARGDAEAAARRFRNALFAVAGAGVIALVALGGSIFEFRRTQENYRVALDQASGNLHDLEVYYHSGQVPTAVLRELVERSQRTIKKLNEADDSDEITIAKIKLLEVISIMEGYIGDYKAIQAALDRDILADRLSQKDPTNPRFREVWAMAHGGLGLLEYWLCDATDAAQEAGKSAAAMEKLLQDQPAIEQLLNDKDYGQSELELMRKSLHTDYEVEGDALRVLGNIDEADGAYHQWLNDAELTLKSEFAISLVEARLCLYQRENR